MPTSHEPPRPTAREPVTVFADHPDAGRVTLDGTHLVMVGDIDSRLFEHWSTGQPGTPVVETVDATGVTHLAAPGWCCWPGSPRPRPPRSGCGRTRGRSGGRCN